jgi:hypothetical protein
MEPAPPTLPDFDVRLALIAATAIPGLLGLALGLSLVLGPLAAWTATLIAYWAVLGGALWARADRDWLAEWLAARWPGWLPALLLGLPVLVLGALTLRELGQAPLPAHLILAAAMGAVAGAALDELFWRGALIPEPTPRSAALSLGLFTLAQVIWLGLLGLDSGVPAPLLLVATVALGGVWTAARLLTGTVGAGLLSHAGYNLFAFVQVIGLNG